MILISDQQGLNEICNEISKDKIIGIDTEFHRYNTYYAKLSTIQIVSGKYQIIIDYLANIDISPLDYILDNPEILKIFHSAREDLEIFNKLFKKLPRNIFDTQIAANICGFGTALSYKDLCQKFCDIRIDKTCQKSNWLKRPIKPKMLKYAIKDVLYLKPLYLSLNEIIVTRNLEKLYQDKIDNLLRSENYKIDPQNAWKKVRFYDQSRDFILRLQVLAAFREESASNADIAKRYFLPDEDLVKICRNLPVSDIELERLNLRSTKFDRAKCKDKLFDLCAGLKTNN